MDNDLRKLLDFDPIYEVEKAAGKSVTGSLEDPVSAASFITHLFHSNVKKNYLKEKGDSYMSMPLIDFVGILIYDGFKCIYEEEFIDPGWESSPKTERLNIYWHDRDGLLVVFDTYWGQKSVNSAKLYYNYKPIDGKVFCELGLGQSGCFHDRTINGIWIGSYDAREALKFHIDNLRTYGDFIVPWVQTDFLWFLNFMDTKDEKYDYVKINKRKLVKIDSKIRNKFITPDSEYYNLEDIDGGDKT